MQTQEGVYTLSAMTAGIRRNWIQAVMKNIWPSTAPDVARSVQVTQVLWVFCKFKLSLMWYVCFAVWISNFIESFLSSDIFIVAVSQFKQWTYTLYCTAALDLKPLVLLKGTNSGDIIQREPWKIVILCQTKVNTIFMCFDKPTCFYLVYFFWRELFARDVEGNFVTILRYILVFKTLWSFAAISFKQRESLWGPSFCINKTCLRFQCQT